MRFSIFLFVTIASAWPAQAQQSELQNVERLLYGCEAALDVDSITSVEGYYDAAFCTGMVFGVGTMLAYNCSSKEEGYLPFYQADVPPSLSAAIQAFVNWARGNPSAWGVPAQDGILLALAENFPCES